MHTRSRVSRHLILRELPKIMVNDLPMFLNMTGIQLAKESFSLRHPFGAKHGRGDKVHQISLRITDICNLRCHTCGQWGDNGYLLDKEPKELRKNEVPVAIYKRLVDQVVEAGWSPVWYIWGGEPMLYPGLLELLYYIAERNMPIMMVSNGTKIAEHASEIVDTCKNIWLSLDGHTPEIHNQQRPGLSSKLNNFQMVQDALIALREERQRRKTIFPYISPISVVARYNIEHLVDIYRFSRQYSDLHIFYLSWWIDEESAKQHTKDFQRRFGFEPRTHLGWMGTWKDFDHHLIYDKFEEMNQLFLEQAAQYDKRTGQSNGNGLDHTCIPLIYPPLASREEIHRYYEDHHEVFGYNQCISIYTTMEIDSNGDVSLCRDYHDYIIGNIREQTVLDIWQGERARQFRASISTDGLMPVCRRCCGLMGF